MYCKYAAVFHFHLIDRDMFAHTCTQHCGHTWSHTVHKSCKHTHMHVCTHTHTHSNTHNLTITWLMAPRLSQAVVLFGCSSAMCMNTYREGKRREEGGGREEGKTSICRGKKEREGGESIRH